MDLDDVGADCPDGKWVWVPGRCCSCIRIPKELGWPTRFIRNPNCDIHGGCHHECCANMKPSEEQGFIKALRDMTDALEKLVEQDKFIVIQKGIG